MPSTAIRVLPACESPRLVAPIGGSFAGQACAASSALLAWWSCLHSARRASASAPCAASPSWASCPWCPRSPGRALVARRAGGALRLARLVVVGACGWHWSATSVSRRAALAARARRSLRLTLSEARRLAAAGLRPPAPRRCSRRRGRPAPPGPAIRCSDAAGSAGELRAPTGSPLPQPASSATARASRVTDVRRRARTRAQCSTRKHRDSGQSRALAKGPRTGGPRAGAAGRRR